MSKKKESPEAFSKALKKTITAIKRDKHLTGPEKEALIKKMIAMYGPKS